MPRNGNGCTSPARRMRKKSGRPTPKLGLKAVVHPFLAEMDLALGAATACVSRAGASSLAELAAMRLPALLVPFPAAADNHQFHNARAFEETGAARLLEQSEATPEKVCALLARTRRGRGRPRNMQAALARWHAPKAAEQIAERFCRPWRAGGAPDIRRGEPRAGPAADGSASLRCEARRLHDRNGCHSGMPDARSRTAR